jgi:hypothetical protein
VFWEYGDFVFPQRLSRGQVDKVESGYAEMMGNKYTLPSKDILIEDNDSVLDVGAFVGGFCKVRGETLIENRGYRAPSKNLPLSKDECRV